MRQLKNDIKLNEPDNKVKSEKNYNFSKMVLPITQTKLEKSAEKTSFLKKTMQKKDFLIISNANQHKKQHSVN